MIKPSILFIVALVALAQNCPFPKESSQETFLLSYDSLTKNKALIEENDELLIAARDILVDRADELLQGKPYSVTYKEDLPNGATPNDYVSLAIYYWPDPDKKNGLPFISIDGKRNPLRESYPDAKMLSSMSSAVQILGLAYFFTEEEKYADRAKDLLQVFFMDEATKMNPHFEFSTLIMGRKSGGNIIDGNPLMRAVDGIQLIKGSPSWTNRHQQEMEKWFAAFLDWMINSEKGKFEASRKNNIATFYTAQATMYALFIGNKGLARKIIESRGYQNIEEQIAPDGTMPMELKRADPWNYISYNLGAFHDLMMIGRNVDIDLWEYRTEKSGSIKQAFDWVESNVDNKKNSVNFNGHYVQKTTVERFFSNNPRPDNRTGVRDLSEVRRSYGAPNEVNRNNYLNILTN